MLFGIHAHRWPAGSDPAPPFTFDAFRTHDCDGMQWRDIESQPGVFDWAVPDKVMSKMRALGVTVVWTLYGTPSFYAASATLDAYGNPGASGPARDPKAASRFAAAVHERYPEALIELWNEPGFRPGSFWTGTPSELVVQSLAVRDACPGATLLSPGFDFPEAIDLFVKSVDPVTGRGGVDSFDALSLHQYGATPASLSSNVASVRARPGRLAKMPIWLTEWGIDGDPKSQAVRDFYVSSTRARTDRIRDIIIAAQALNLAGFFIYSFGGPLSGDLINDKQGAIYGVMSATAKTMRAKVTAVIRSFFSK